jgi:hypothetical protein
VIEGLAQGGVVGIVKHMPGHGRAMVDSHHELPIVTADEDALTTDLAPFQALKDAPIGMTAHVVYTAWDPDLPASLSASVIAMIIRQRIGFDGLLMSDDLDMKALKGSIPELAAGVVAAGCDLALNCWGRMDDMIGISCPTSAPNRRRGWIGPWRTPASSRKARRSTSFSPRATRCSHWSLRERRPCHIYRALGGAAGRKPFRVPPVDRSGGSRPLSSPPRLRVSA